MLSTKASLGLFVTVGAALFALGLFWVGDRKKKVFSRGFEVHTEMDRVAGLEPGANVRVAGLDAGEVKGIDVPSEQGMGYRLRIRLDREFQPLIRQDSLASIQTDGLVGSKYLEIGRGSEDAMECSDPCTIMSKKTLDFSDLMAEASAAMQGAGQVTKDLNRALDTFLAKDEEGKSGAANLTETVASAQTAMTNLADNTEALKHNFFFRGFFNKRGFFDLNEMSPSKYRDSDFAKSKDAHRIWLDAKQLFATNKKGVETLTEDGKNALDTAMGQYVAFLPNSPLMIEGYSDEGSAEEKYRKAQQRGVLAQNYIQSRFKLNPKYVGSIPLVETPPAKTDKDSWDGLALVLIPTK